MDWWLTWAMVVLLVILCWRIVVLEDKVGSLLIRLAHTQKELERLKTSWGQRPVAAPQPTWIETVTSCPRYELPGRFRT